MIRTHVGDWARYALDNPKKSRLRRYWARYTLENPKKIAPAALLGPPRPRPPHPLNRHVHYPLTLT